MPEPEKTPNKPPFIRPPLSKTPLASAPKRRKRSIFRTLLWVFFTLMVVRIFFLVSFFIPSSSMENNLMVGDFVLVSKTAYGIRLPMSIPIPFTQRTIPNIEFPYIRLFSKPVQRGDVVVFNYPGNQHPIDTNTSYIKRAVGLPGDEVEIEDKVLLVNGHHYPLGNGMKQAWLIQLTDANMVIPEPILSARNLLIGARVSPKELWVHGSTVDVQYLKSLPYVVSVEPYVRRDFVDHVFPKGAPWSLDVYGPLKVPKSGETIPINAQTWAAYHSVILQFEGNASAVWKDNRFLLDGKPQQNYTFRKNYYFMLGDNRDDSVDSRIWGFVPEDHLVGKALMVYFSTHPQTMVPRFDRMLKSIGS